MNAITTQLLKGSALAMLLSAVFTACAGEPAKPDKEKTEKPAFKPNPWRPYKDVPDVLFFETFETQPAWIKEGKIAEDPTAPSGKNVLKLDSGKDSAIMKGQFIATQLKFPSGLQPKDISISFAINSDEAGQVVVKFLYTSATSKSDYQDTTPVPKVKTWGVVTMKLSDMIKDKKRAAEPDQIISDIEISVKPPKNHKGDAPKVMIDDFIITVNGRPEDLKPRVMQAEKKRLDMEKRVERDGYAYSMSANDFLKDLLKPFKGKKTAKSVLVFGGSPAETESWVKSLSAAPKAKESGFAFSAAASPESGTEAIGGLADLRMLIQYNLAKNTELALFIIGMTDANGPGRPAENIRVAIERALAMGTVPVVVVPAPENSGQAAKAGAFAKAMAERCTQLGVPCIDASFLQAKDAKGVVTVAPVPAEKVAALTMTALKHLHDSLEKN